jgi:hypothetical protein
MTGKTATLRYIENLARDADIKVAAIDLRPLAESLTISDDPQHNSIALLNFILGAIAESTRYKKTANIEGYRASQSILAERFLKVFRDIIGDASSSERMIVTLDHLYMFGPQNPGDTSSAAKTFDELLTLILSGIVKLKFVVDKVTLFIADDGAQASHPEVSPYITKGKKLTLVCDEQTANAVWTANGIPDIDNDTSVHFDLLGRCIFLHHAAAELAASKSPTLRGAEQACIAIADAIAYGTATGHTLLDQRLSEFRRRVTAWLNLKAVHCGIPFADFYQALTDNDRGLNGLALSAMSAAELATALEWGTMFGDPNRPAGFLRKLAKAEADAQKAKK